MVRSPLLFKFPFRPFPSEHSRPGTLVSILAHHSKDARAPGTECSEGEKDERGVTLSADRHQVRRFGHRRQHWSIFVADFRRDTPFPNQPRSPTPPPLLRPSIDVRKRTSLRAPPPPEFDAPKGTAGWAPPRAPPAQSPLPFTPIIPLICIWKLWG